MNSNPVRGRYAPSPTGRLHLGNLQTALLVWLQVRLAKGKLVLRIDDLDQARNVAGAEEQIYQDLKWLGLDWDEGPDVGGPFGPYRQSERLNYYAEAITRLDHADKLYPCICSRKDIASALSAPNSSDQLPIYPGTCRERHTDHARDSTKMHSKPLAWRYKVADQTVAYDDRILGPVSQNLATDVGDFVVKRKDGQFAYHLTSVVDDQHMNITDVVRGADLSLSTPRQLSLIQFLEYTRPQFWHVPLVKDEQGQRLSKRDGSTSIKQWLEKGRTSEQLVGEFAYSVGLINTPYAIHPQELLGTLTTDKFHLELSNIRAG